VSRKRIIARSRREKIKILRQKYVPKAGLYLRSNEAQAVPTPEREKEKKKQSKFAQVARAKALRRMKKTWWGVKVPKG